MEQNLSLNHLGNSKQVKCCKHENIPILCWQFNGGYPDTFRSIRINSNSFKFIQIHSDSSGSIPIHSNLSRYFQNHPDPIQVIQIYPDPFQFIQIYLHIYWTFRSYRYIPCTSCHLLFCTVFLEKDFCSTFAGVFVIFSLCPMGGDCIGPWSSTTTRRVAGAGWWSSPLS